MSSAEIRRKPKWFNNGWIGLVVLLLAFAILFLSGRYSPTYEPNPQIEGRLLSEWTDDLKSIGWEDSGHEKAVAVLKANRAEVVPVLIEWLGEKDTFPQSVYFSTMTLLEGKGTDLLDYRGSYFNQLHAAWAFKHLDDARPEVIEALEGVVEQYGGTRHYAGEVAAETLQKLKARRASAPAP